MIKTIVFDFDDTISFAENRDWENAKANIPLIDKINSLYDKGWTILIYTARGSLSCKTREEAEQNNSNQIEGWLNRHGVKYHELSFKKPLAMYYVDDRAILPEDFIKLELE